MNAGSYVGRIGGLAVALGVGAAVFTGHGVAYASTDGDSSASGGASGTGSTSGSSSTSTSTSTSTTESSDAKSGTDATSSDKDSSDTPDADDTDDTTTGTGKKDRHTLWSDLFGGHKPKPGTEAEDPDATPETPPDGTEQTPTDGAEDPADTGKTPPKKPRWSWKPAEASPTTSADDSADATEAPAKKPLKSLLASITVDAPETTKPASTLVAVSTAAQTPETTATVVPTDTAEATTSTVSQGPLATLFKRFLDIFSGNAPASPAANSPFAWVAAAASRRELAAAQTDDPTMYWNGYEVVPVGEPTIGQFYGKYTMVPAFPGIVQGKQDFDLVDENGTAVATIHGLVTYNNDVGSGNRLLQIMVDDVDFNVDGVEYGTKLLDIPRPGSVFASVSNGKYGNVYSALDNPDGKDVVTYKFVTKNFTLPLNPDPFRIGFSSANFLYDNEGVNRPVYTQDGYYIKPTTATTPWTAYAAYQPLFNAIQGHNTFGVYDADTNELVGTFEGVVTVTSDFWGTTSEAILVTDPGTTNVGVGAGQIPPEGTIYNIIYWTEDPTNYLLYYAKPNERPGANVTRTVQVYQQFGKPRTLDLTFRFDAAAPPVRESLDIPGRNGTGYSFVPDSKIVYSGVNGLPPREAIVQGYQTFKVYDSDGEYLGTVSADVSRQWNLAGNSSEAILVTGILAGEAGAEAGKVPPVGSVFNWNYTGNTGFGEAYYAMPTESGESKISYQFVTPFGGIPAFINYDAAKGLGDYNYDNPFGGTQQNFNLLSAAGAESGALLGAGQPLCVLDGSTACEVA